MNNFKNGFTLSELLMALIIVGVVAVLTVPALMNNINNKVYANQIKNMAATIEQLAQDQLVTHRVRDLSDTDFANPDKLLSDYHFSIAKKCESSKAQKECWKTTATDSNKVKYKLLSNNSELSPSSISTSADDAPTLILKNGVIIRYMVVEKNDAYGYFVVDVNGNDGPNIQGRDLFGFYISYKGHVGDKTLTKSDSEEEEGISLNAKITSCKGRSNLGDESWCYGALADNAWKMDY